jgi:hypothetical protein
VIIKIINLAAKLATSSDEANKSTGVGGKADQRFMSWITGHGWKTDADRGLVSENAQVASALGVASDKSANDMIAEGMGKQIAASVQIAAPSIAGAAEKAGSGAANAFKPAPGSFNPFEGASSNVAKGLALGVDPTGELAMHSAEMAAKGAAAAVGAAGINSSRSEVIGGAAGTNMSSKKAVSVRVGDVYVQPGAGQSTGDAASSVHEYFETEFGSMLERHLEGNGG